MLMDECGGRNGTINLRTEYKNHIKRTHSAWVHFFFFKYVYQMQTTVEMSSQMQASANKCSALHPTISLNWKQKDPI